ncbi:MAG: hypothetical protein GX557_15720, partial [Chloroflexi bacterium]|nr:hypothetical protein [Chloroflexota bacterium]
FGAQNCMGLLGQVRQYTDRVTPNGFGAISTSTPLQLPAATCDSGLVLSFWYRIQSWDTAWGLDVDDGKEKWFDPFWVYVRRGDNPSDILGSFLPEGNLTDRSQWVPEVLYDSGWRRYSVDLTPWAGQFVWIDFRVWNFVDDQLPTWVFIDDVKLLPTEGRVVPLPLIFRKVGGRPAPSALPTPVLPANAARPAEPRYTDELKPRK